MYTRLPPRNLFFVDPFCSRRQPVHTRFWDEVQLARKTFRQSPGIPINTNALVPLRRRKPGRPSPRPGQCPTAPKRQSFPLASCHLSADIRSLKCRSANHDSKSLGKDAPLCHVESPPHWTALLGARQVSLAVLGGLDSALSLGPLRPAPSPACLCSASKFSHGINRARSATVPSPSILYWSSSLASPGAIER